MCSQVREAHPHGLPGSEYSGLLRCRCGLHHSDDDGDSDVDDLLCKWHCDVVWVEANYDGDSDNDGINENKTLSRRKTDQDLQGFSKWGRNIDQGVESKDNDSYKD